MYNTFFNFCYYLNVLCLKYKIINCIFYFFITLLHNLCDPTIISLYNNISCYPVFYFNMKGLTIYFHKVCLLNFMMLVLGSHYLWIHVLKITNWYKIDDFKKKIIYCGIAQYKKTIKYAKLQKRICLEVKKKDSGPWVPWSNLPIQRKFMKKICNLYFITYY